MKKIAIIGGGLSGLYAAYRLQDNYDVTLFEARDRLGGRAHTVDGFDLGPSWIWPHQTHILSLIRSLGLEVFKQYDTGYALFDQPSGVQRFIPSQNPPSYRIAGGMQKLIESLSSKLTATQIHISQAVISLTQNEDDITLKTHSDDYVFDTLIVTLPPRLILQSLQFNPPLAQNVQMQLSSIHTWMGNAVKCVIEFSKPFWRDMGLSGFCFSHIGPMAEVHDACSHDRFALFGFIHSKASLKSIEQDVKTQLSRLFDTHSYEIIGFHCVDWRDERYTSVDADRIALQYHPEYGIHTTHFNDKVHFIGTETSYIQGGYLEGAITSVERLKLDEH